MRLLKWSYYVVRLHLEILITNVGQGYALTTAYWIKPEGSSLNFGHDYLEVPEDTELERLGDTKPGGTAQFRATAPKPGSETFLLIFYRDGFKGFHQLQIRFIRLAWDTWRWEVFDLNKAGSANLNR